MMKKIASLLLIAALLMMAPAVAEQADDEVDNDPLSLDELWRWADELVMRAEQEQPMSLPMQTEEGYQFIYPFATLYLTTAAINNETVIKAVEIKNPETEGPHATHTGMTVQEVLDSYYMDNADLEGTPDAAALYLVSTERGIQYGWVQRDQQQVLLVEYAACEQAENGMEGYTDAGVTYVVEDGLVTAIRAYGLDERMTESMLRDRDAEIEALLGRDDYGQVRTSYDGSELEPFGDRDLQFSGINFWTMDSVQTVSALGEVKSEEWIEDGEQGYIHLLTFADCQVTVLCDGNKSNPKTEMVTIFSDGMEGPRRTRIGDSMVSVRNRFRHSEGDLIEGTNIEVLYGTLVDPAYGTAEYGMDGTNVMRYVYSLDRDVDMMLRFTFEDYLLTEIVLCKVDE